MKSEKIKEHNPTYHETNHNIEADNSYSKAFEVEWKSNIKEKEINHEDN